MVNLEMKNSQTQIGTSETSITKRIKKMEETITGFKDKAEEIDIIEKS